MPLDDIQLKAVANSLAYVHASKRRYAYINMLPLLCLSTEEENREFTRVERNLSLEQKTLLELRAMRGTHRDEDAYEELYQRAKGIEDDPYPE
jgi:hypothetical protein